MGLNVANTSLFTKLTNSISSFFKKIDNLLFPPKKNLTAKQIHNLHKPSNQTSSFVPPVILYNSDDISVNSNPSSNNSQISPNSNVTDTSVGAVDMGAPASTADAGSSLATSFFDSSFAFSPDLGGAAGSFSL
jgi:hypothetical protein